MSNVGSQFSSRRTSTSAMFSYIIGVLCITICAHLPQINAQEVCIPQSVVNISISYDSVLTWSPNPDEQCSILHYLVHIDNDVGTERIYLVSRPSLTLSLPVCDNYLFRIAPIGSGNVEGADAQLATKIPLPENANLTVGLLKVTQGDGQWVHLDWSMDDSWLKCADRFRVVISDQDVDHLQDIYTFNTSVSIPNMAPCTSYEFGVMAIYNWAIEGPVTVVKHTTPEAVIRPPTLRNIALDTTTANLTWSVDAYVFNKCPISRAEVTVVNNYNLTVDILDQTERQSFNVVLTNLQSQNLYRVNVAVVNSAGPSQPVLLAIQTA